tara:strand:+ start:112 stop:471 length:360 start_codon:yes stop_codon:yes gene_type:complete
MEHQIKKIRWGAIKINSKKVKDLKIFPGGYRSWDWNETGTRHCPGIQPSDIQELIDNGATTIILSAGMENRLELPDETKKWLKEKNISFHYLQTEEAVKKYNELAAYSNKIGGLFHSTC